MAQDPNLVSGYVEEMSKIANKLNYVQQAQFFLNAMWKECKDSAEHLWEVVKLMEEFAMNDKDRKKRDHSLDQFQSCRVFQTFDNAITATKFTEMMREIDSDSDKRMSILEYAVFKFKVNIEDLMTRPQGSSKLLDELEDQLNKIRKKIKDVESKKKKWDGKPVPESGVQKITYDNDMLVLNEAESFLKENLDLAQKKLRGAQSSKDIQSPGKQWWLKRQLEEVQKYKPPKKQLK